MTPIHPLRSTSVEGTNVPRGSPAPAANLAGLLAQALAAQAAGDFEAAERLYHQFLAHDSGNAIALNNHALVAKSRGDRKSALSRFNKAARLHPGSAAIHFNRANLLQDMDRLEEAAEGYRRAIALKPDYAKAYQNLGNVLDKQRLFNDAIVAYRHALALGGENAETHVNIGNSLKALGRFRDAAAHYSRAVALEPRAEFHHSLGVTLFDLRDYDRAAVAFRRVLQINPDHEGTASSLLYLAQIACDWKEVDRLLPIVRAATDRAVAAGTPSGEGALESISRDADPRRNLAAAHGLARQHPIPDKPLAARRSRNSSRLRIGYLSGDFRDHPVAHLMAGVFRRHDRRVFEVTAYSYGVDDASTWRKAVAQGCERFVDLATLGDPDAARRIAADKVDVLIDLAAWTNGSRPAICALRPAPVQIQYLGFPGSSGAPFYDYAIVDPTIAPPEHRPFWSEALVYMPHSYIGLDAADGAATMTRETCGLPDAAFVFCSFNQSYKIDTTVFDAWITILQSVPGSVLWLASSNRTADASLKREASARGIDAARLIFAERVADKADHLVRLALADLALDTLAYNGHSTTGDALISGLPVITALGGHFASRVSASLLRSTGLAELVAESIDGYVSLATRFAADAAWRAAIRAQLEAAPFGTPLFDMGHVVADFERGIRKVWERFLSGQPPEDIHL